MNERTPPGQGAVVTGSPPDPSTTLTGDPGEGQADEALTHPDAHGVQGQPKDDTSEEGDAEEAE